MKKLFLLAVAAVAAFSAYAQDVIITRDAKRVEAKILEVSSNEIKYKEFNNQDGPTFVLTTNEINTVIYQNGTVKVFEHSRQAAPVYGAAAYAAPAYGAPQATGLPIVRDDKTYIMGDVRMTEDQYIAFVQQNCQQAYESYMKGKKLRKAGWGLFASGLTFMGVGSVLYGLGYGLGGPETTYSKKSGYSTKYRDEDLFLGLGIPGAVLLGAGSALFVASIPCIVVGTIKRNNSHEIYNANCAQKTALEFGIQTSQNGVGLAMKF